MNALSFLCALFIIGDWSGHLHINNFGYFICWLVVISSPCQEKVQEKVQEEIKTFKKAKNELE